MLVPVTTPRSCQPTVDCAAMSVGAATSPIPRPMTKHVAATWITVDDAFSRPSSAVPATARALPINAQARNPIRRYSFPDCAADTGQPSVSAPTARPAMTAPVPRTSCTYVAT